MTPRLKDAKRLVIKIGSALLVDEGRGAIHRSWLEGLAADIASIWLFGASDEPGNTA